MEEFLLLVLIVILLVRWAVLRDRLNRVDSEIQALKNRLAAQEWSRSFETPRPPVPVAQPEPIPQPAPPPPPPPPPQPEPWRIVPPPPPPPEPEEAPIPPWQPPTPSPAFSMAVPQRTSEEWETMLGGNWLNKIGVLVTVVGLALLLGYSFTHMGPVGIVSISLAGSAAMLITGVIFETRETYRIFARGLISGGWAGLYVTVYSMHAVAAAKVIENPVTGAVLLLLVAAGMIVHSLIYRSEIVTGLTYFIAYFTLAITQSNVLSLMAMVPLAASLLYAAHYFRWGRLAIGGLLATYVTCALRPDTGAPLWEAQAIFAVYWLLFEAYDILQRDTWLLPMNAAGVLGLSLIKWHRAAPDRVWGVLAAAAIVYLISAILRSRRGRWHGAATLTAGLAAAAIFQKLDFQWVASALVVEAELFYLAGLRLRAPYLRWLGTALFGIEAARLVSDVGYLPVATWAPVAALDVVVFYANRFLCEADLFFGYAGAAALALLVGYEAPRDYLGICWLLAAAVPLAFGWWRRKLDIRLHGYFLYALGLIGAGFDLTKLSLGTAAAFSYALAVFGKPTDDHRLGEGEGEMLRTVASLSVIGFAATFLWRAMDPAYLGIAWMCAAVLLMEIGIAGWPSELHGFSLALAALGIFRIAGNEFPQMHNFGPLTPRLIPAAAGLLCYYIGWQSRRLHRYVAGAGSWIGTGFLAVAMWALLPSNAVALSWALYAAGLLFLGLRPWPKPLPDGRGSESEPRASASGSGMPQNLAVMAPDLQNQSWVLAAVAYGWWAVRLTVDQAALTPGTLLGCAATIACFYGAQLLAPRSHALRLYNSLLATTLTGLLLFDEISGRLLSIAWGIQGVLLLAAGFPLRDRILRLSGLAILLFCILKLFIYDLSYLDTLPRIFSFLVLGMLLVAVSWVYTRFRDRVARYL